LLGFEQKQQSCAAAMVNTGEREVSSQKVASNQDWSHSILRHCVVHHYSFQIKKCGLDTYSICKPVRMSKESFLKLHYLPDPVTGEENHFKRFKDLYGTVISEEFRPSLQKRSKCKTLPFSASI